MSKDDRLFATIGGCVVVLAGAFFLWSGFDGGGGGQPTVAQAPAPRQQPIEVVELTPEPATEPSSAIRSGAQRAVLEGGGSPGIVAASDWSADAVASWQPDLLIDVPTVVSAIDAIAGGKSPADELGSLLPGRDEVLVREDREGRMVVAAGTLRRYAAVVDAIAGIEPATVVAEYHRLQEQLDEASAEQAGDSGFLPRLHQALDHLLAVEIPEEAPEMKAAASHWDFADEGLEQLSDAQRHLLLMGRNDALTLQARLRELRDAFGWQAPAPPTRVAEAGPAVEIEAAEEELVAAASEPLSAETFEIAGGSLTVPVADDALILGPEHDLLVTVDCP